MLWLPGLCMRPSSLGNMGVGNQVDSSSDLPTRLEHEPAEIASGSGQSHPLCYRCPPPHTICLFTFAANGVAAFEASCRGQGPAETREGRRGLSPERCWYSPPQWALMSPVSLSPSTLLPRRAEKFRPEVWNQPVGLQGERYRFGLLLLAPSPWAMVVQREAEVQGEALPCFCHDAACPAKAQLRPARHFGLSLCLAQVVNEVPELCLVGKSAAGREALPIWFPAQPGCQLWGNRVGSSKKGHCSKCFRRQPEMGLWSACPGF